MPPLQSCRECHLRSTKCDRGRPCTPCVNAGRQCTYDKVMVKGIGKYLRDDGRTRHGKLVTPDQPAAPPPAPAPSAVVPSAESSTAAVQDPVPGGVTNETLPIAPLHLWRDFSGPLVHTPIDTSGTPFPWPPRSERVPSSWRQFASSATAEMRMGNGNEDGAQERDGGDDDKDEEMSDGDDEGDDVEEAQGRTAGDDNASKK